MALSIVIKDEAGEYLKYNLDQFIDDFVDKVASRAIPLVGKERKKNAYWVIADELIRNFKNNTKGLPAHIR